MEGGECEECRRGSFEERQAQAELRLAKHRAAIVAFVARQTPCRLEDAFDKLIEHLLPDGDADRRQLRFCRPRSSWHFELRRDGAVDRVLKVPPEAASYFGTVLHLLSVDDPAARFLCSLPSTWVERVPQGYAIVRRPVP